MSRKLGSADFIGVLWKDRAEMLLVAQPEERKYQHLHFTMPMQKSYNVWRDNVVGEAQRRYHAKINTLIIGIPGKLIYLDLRFKSQIKFQVPVTAGSISVFAPQKDRKLLLAIYRLPDFNQHYRFEEIKPAAITLEGGQRIQFDCSPIKNGEGRVINASIRIGYCETKRARALLLLW